MIRYSFPSPWFSALLGVTSVYSLTLLWCVTQGRQDVLAVDLLYMVVIVLSAGVVWPAWRASSGEMRRSLGWAAGSLACLALAEVTFVVNYDLTGLEAPDISASDGLYYLYYLGLIATLLLGLRGQRSLAGAGGWLLDSLITVLVVGEAAWVLALAPMLLDLESSALLKGVNLSYVALDLTLLTLTLIALRGPLARSRLPLLLGLLMYVLADLMYFALGSRYETRGPLDLLWAWGTVGQAAGLVLLSRRAGQAGHSAPLRLEGQLERLLSALPYGAVAAASLLLVGWSAADDLTRRGVVWFTVTVFLLVMLRQALTFREKSRLNEQLLAQTAELNRSRDQMEYQAFHDVLTGLYNRAGFYRLLRQRLPGPGTDLLMLDLDGFKPVNDTLGHAAGDAVLREVAARLLGCATSQFTAARIGGDEFVLISAAPLLPAEVDRVALEVVKALSEPIVLSDRAVRVSVSVGVAYSRELDSDEHQALLRADAAMYRAKRAGGSRVARPEPA